MICGDPNNDSWKSIPLSQSQFHLKSFLQERGYYHPKFEEKNKNLIINLGKPTYISSLKSVEMITSFSLSKKRKFVGQLLTPKNLTLIEQWSIKQLKAIGFACPVVTSEADSKAGDVLLHLQTGPPQNLVSVDEEEVKGLARGVLRRDDAFKLNRPYNGDLLELTARRTEQEGTILSTHFTTQCTEKGAEVKQKIIPGRPRLLTFSFGANTEQWVVVQGSWKHTRLGKMGSLIDLSFYGSKQIQRLDTSGKWYFRSKPSRWHLKPIISFIHDLETQFQTITLHTGISIATSWDDQSKQIQLQVGPDLNYIYTISGAQPGFSRFVSLQYQFEMQSHYYEYYQNSPRTGYDLKSWGSFNDQILLSTVSAQSFNISGKYLWNLKGYDPPLLVTAVRGGFSTTFTHGEENRDRLPPNYKFYLGGMEDLRGFSRQELPGDKQGALSSFFLSTEVRLASLIPYGFQPFVFTDAGILARKPLKFDTPIYWSPGLGIRWESPIGVIRGTISHGFKVGQSAVGDPSNHWQYYISFGQEF